jgi:hypothetical protein
MIGRYAADIVGLEIAIGDAAQPVGRTHLSDEAWQASLFSQCRDYLHRSFRDADAHRQSLLNMLFIM